MLIYSIKEARKLKAHLDAAAALADAAVYVGTIIVIETLEEQEIFERFTDALREYREVSK